MIKGVLFDMDGVIFNTGYIWKLCYEKANEKFGLKLDENYRQNNMMGKSDKDIRAQLKKEFPNLDVEAYRDYTQQSVETIMHSSCNLLKPYFLEIVKDLKSKGIKLALATSSSRERCNILFKNHQINREEVFDFSIMGDDVTKSKPDPEIFLKASAGLNLKPEECIVLEDSVLGLKSAHSAGCYPVMVVDMIKPNSETERFAKKIVNSLKEADEYILTEILPSQNNHIQK